MSALDFDRGNASRYFTFAAGLPAGDFTLIAWLRNYSVAGSGLQAPFGLGGIGSASSFYPYYGQSGAGTPGWALVAVDNASGVVCNTALALGGLTADGVPRLLAFVRSGTNLNAYLVPRGAGDASLFKVTVAGATTGAINSGTWNFGRDGGGDGRYWPNPLGEFGILGSALSDAQVTALAGGLHLSAFGVPTVELRFRDGALATEKNRGSAGATSDATLFGTASTYLLADDFFPDGNPETIHREARRPPRRSASDKGIDLSGWLSPSSWLDPLAANATNTPVTITTITGDATAAGATALIDQKRVIATTTGDATAGGPTALINNARVIATTTGNAGANGATAQIDQQRKISTTTGNAVADGTTAQINQARTISTTTGDAVANGVTAQVGSNLTVTTSTGNAVADGVTAKINQARVISTATGNAVADGATARVDQQRVIQTTTGDAAAGGPTALINNARTIQTTAGNAVADGATARVDQARTIQTTTGDAVANGITASISGSVVIVTTPGNAVADGVPAQIIVGPDLLAATLPTIGGSGAEQEDEADVSMRGAMVAQVITALIAAGVLD